MGAPFFVFSPTLDSMEFLPPELLEPIFQFWHSVTINEPAFFIIKVLGVLKFFIYISE